MTDKEIFSQNLRKYVKQSGKQQKDIAVDLGYSPTTFGNWCTGLAMPKKLSVIRKIADYFMIDVSCLTDESPDPRVTGVQLTDDEMQVLHAYRMLNDAEKSMIRAALRIPDQKGEGSSASKSIA